MEEGIGMCTFKIGDQVSVKAPGLEIAVARVLYLDKPATNLQGGTSHGTGIDGVICLKYNINDQVCVHEQFCTKRPEASMRWRK